MDFSILSLSGALVCAAFFFAGIIDAVCGGGGLLTLPVFLATGFPVHFISGTNQVGACFGAITSFCRFAKKGHVYWPVALMTIPIAICGSFLGAHLNMVLPERYLQLVMVLLIPIVSAIVLLKRDFGSENHVAELTRFQLLRATILIGLLMGCYQGFYAAGSGTFFLIGFASLTRLDLIKASGTTKAVVMFAVITSSLTYAASGAVYWPMALLAAVFNITGNYIGSSLAMTKGARIIRPMFLCILALLLVRLVGGLFL